MASLSDEDVFVPAEPDLEEPQGDDLATTKTPDASSKTLKRKAGNADEKPKGKPKKAKVDESGETNPVGYAPPFLQADYIAKAQDRWFPNATAIEKEETRIPESYFLDVSAHEDRLTLSDFVTQALPDLAKQISKPSKKKGSPRALVVSSAALRATDLCRDLKKVASKGEVAKLFAKHFKLAEHVTYCQKTAFSIGAGTPDRILKLIDAKALLLDSLTFLILDVSYIDSKKRSLLDHKEAATVVLKDVLGHAQIREKLNNDKLKLVFY